MSKQSPSETKLFFSFEEMTKTFIKIFSKVRYDKLKSFALKVDKNSANEAEMMMRYIVVSMCATNYELQLCHFAELVLRNHLDAAFKKHFGENWIQDFSSKFNPQIALVQHRSKPHREFYYRVEKVKKQLRQNRKVINNNSLVHELEFYFWENLTKRTFYDYWQVVYNDFFEETSESFDRHKVGNLNCLIKEIKHIRNRISHLQPYDISVKSNTESNLKMLLQCMDSKYLLIFNIMISEHFKAQHNISKNLAQIYSNQNEIIYYDPVN